jgi:hypothetical protein
VLLVFTQQRPPVGPPIVRRQRPRPPRCAATRQRGPFRASANAIPAEEVTPPAPPPPRASALPPQAPLPRLEVGKITTDVIYKRLAPGVREELKRITPRNEKGYLTHRMHQHLTDDIGNPKLEKHLAVVMAVMDLSPDWATFMANINKVLPVFGKNYELPLNDARPEGPMRALAASLSSSPEAELQSSQ